MRRASIAFLLLAVTFCLQANTVDRRVRALVDDLARKYLLSREALVSKQTVTLVEMKNVSPLAEKNFVGEAIGERIKAAIQDSLVFTYVERELLEESLREIELALSDLSEGGSVEVGRIEEVSLLLAGSVLEQGDNFLVTLQLVDVQTTSVAAVSRTAFAKSDLIAAGSAYAFSYIMANGLGASLNATPAWFLILPAQEMVRHADDLYHSLAFGSKLTYRLSKAWKVDLELGFENQYVLYEERRFGDFQNMPTGLGEGVDLADSMEFMESDGSFLGTIASDVSVHYAVQERPISLALPASYVHSFNHRLNLSVGLGPSVQFIDFIQAFDNIPIMIGSVVASHRKEIHMWFVGLGALAKLELEYFFLPRLALNVGASWLQSFILPQAEREARCSTSGEYYYTEDNVSYEAFGMSPFTLPNGDPMDEKLYKASYGRLYLGFAVYF